MAKTFRPWDVEQRWLLPPSVLELVPADHAAHFVRETVRESLDLSTILDEYNEERGFPPYHPVMMTALLLYAYTQGVFSSRRIARGCEERVDFMAVTALQKPDFRTVNEFRRRHLKALGALFGQVLVLCGKAGLVKLGHVALDGTKIKANASKHKAMSYGRMKKAEPELEAVVEKWFERAEAADREEDRLYGRDKRGDEMPDWVANREKRLEKIREAKAALEAEAREKAEKENAKAREEGRAGAPRRGPPRKERSGVPPDKAQRNFTDPDSRIMKGPDGFVQAYNCQAAVDAESQVIVAQAVSNSPTDVQQLKPMVKQIKENTGRQARELSADAGYCSEANLKELNRRRIRGFVSTSRQRHGGASENRARSAAKGAYTRAMALRLKRGGHRSRYRLRKQVAEPVFGQLKQGLGFRTFLMRGLTKVRGEYALVCAAFNLLKLMRASWQPT